MTLTPRVPIRTERLLLRHVTAGDAEAMHAYKSDPGTCRYLPHDPLSLDEVNERIAGVWARRTLDAEGQGITLAIEDCATGRVVGEAVLIWHSERHRSFEIGYGLRPDVRGRGYVTEAAGALLPVVFDEFGMHRAVAQLDARNGPSARVLERLGMRREAHYVEDYWTKGEWSSSLWYGMTDSEWRARAAPRP